MAFFQSREMPIQTKSTQAREKRKLIRRSIFFVIPFLSVCLSFHFRSAVGSVQMGLCWNHTVTKNEARQRGCDLGTAGQQFWEEQQLAVTEECRGRRVSGLEPLEGTDRVLTVILLPRPQCAANVAFFKLKFDQLMERRWRVCRAESRQNLQSKA